MPALETVSSHTVPVVGFHKGRWLGRIGLRAAGASRRISPHGIGVPGSKGEAFPGFLHASFLCRITDNHRDTRMRASSAVSDEPELPEVREATRQDDIDDQQLSEAARKEYSWRQALTFSGIVAGYATYYFTRMSFTYVAPLIKADATLGIDMNALGTITTVFPICYAFSKFAGGVLGDATDARTIHALGLIITGSINIAFGCGSTLSWFAMCWALNGLFQGFGAPPCAKILANWYPSTTRGTWWGRWNASHNIGGFLIPLVAAGWEQPIGR